MTIAEPLTRHIEEVSAKTYARELRKGQYYITGTLTRQPEINFTHRAAHGSSSSEDSSGDIQVSLEASTKVLQQLQEKYSSVFSEPTFPIQRPNPEAFEHRIRLRDEAAPPPRRKIYPLD